MINGGAVLKNFIEYIEDSCKNIKDSHIAYTYKRKILDEMIYNLCDNAIKYNKENGCRSS